MTCKIAFFRVEACGYYKWRSKSPEFCSISDVINRLGAWTIDNELNIDQTATFAAGDLQDQLPVYCLGTHKRRSEEAVVTWNETEGLDGDYFGSVKRSSRVNEAQLSRTPVPEGSIPGHPSYFWFIPDRSVIAAIRLPRQRLYGNRGLQAYFQNFLTSFSSHVVREDDDDETSDVVGYCKDEASPPLHLYPRFRLRRARRAGDEALIRANRNRITKVVRRKTLKYTQGVDKSFIQQVLKLLGLSQVRQVGSTLRFQSEIAIQPSTSELTEILASFDTTDNSGWDDLGFIFKGDGRVHWVSETSPTLSIDLDIDLDESGVASAESLSDALHTHRDRILRAIP